MIEMFPMPPDWAIPEVEWCVLSIPWLARRLHNEEPLLPFGPKLSSGQTAVGTRTGRREAAAIGGPAP